MMTAYRARSIRRRRSSSEGKKLPARSLGIASSRSPAWRGQRLLPVPVAQGGAGLGVLVPLGADPGGGLGLDQFLQHALGHRADESRLRPPHVVTPAAATGQTGTRPSCTPRVGLSRFPGALHDGCCLFRGHEPEQRKHMQGAPTQAHRLDPLHHDRGHDPAARATSDRNGHRDSFRRPSTALG